MIRSNFKTTQSSFCKFALAFIIFGCSTYKGNAAPPAWWSGRGAINNSPKQDYAVVNQGQLKHFTTKAIAELNAKIPGGAGEELNSLAASWQLEYQSGEYTISNPNPEDFAAVNSGQLKWISKKISNRLIYARYLDGQPAWLSTADFSTNKELVNIGQLKTVLNFDLTAPAGELPSWWKKFYFATLPVSALDASDFSGLSLLDCYQQGISPHSPPTPPQLLVYSSYYYDPQQVDLNVPAGCIIYYTLDGSDPVSSGTRTMIGSNTSLSFDQTKQLKAVVKKNISGLFSSAFSITVNVDESEIVKNAYNRRPRYLLRNAP